MRWYSCLAIQAIGAMRSSLSEPLQWADDDVALAAANFVRSIASVKIGGVCSKHDGLEFREQDATQWEVTSPSDLHQTARISDCDGFILKRGEHCAAFARKTVVSSCYACSWWMNLQNIAVPLFGVAERDNPGAAA